MPAFDKNSVLVEHAFKITPGGDDAAALLSCPRCGHKMERKHRTMCLGCKRMIPPLKARQSWEPLVKNVYAEQLNPREKEIKEFKFKLTKQGYWEVLRNLRHVAVVAVCLASVIYSVPLLGKAAWGEAKYNKIAAQFGYMFGPDAKSVNKVATKIKNFF